MQFMQKCEVFLLIKDKNYVKFSCTIFSKYAIWY